MRLYYTVFMALVCFLIGFGMFGYKAAVLEFPLFPNEQTHSWHVETKLEFRGSNKAVKASVFLPRTSERYSIVDENFISSGYGFTTEIEPETNNRMVSWTKRKENGKTVIFYRAILYEVHSSDGAASKAPKITNLTYKDWDFRERAKSDPAYLALSELITELHDKSADTDSFVKALTKQLKNKKDERVTRIREDNDDIQNDITLVAFILNHAAIPARVMNGIVLESDRRDASLKQWVEYYADKEWHIVQLGAEKLNKDTLLPWWQGADKFFELDGGRAAHIAVSVKKHTENVLTEAIWQGDEVTRTIYNLSLFSLPIDVQLVFSILLLVPIGSLVNAFLRQVIGIVTFGTFMPVLIALSFRETGLIWGIFLFTMIIGMGLAFRGYFDRLRLLLVARLTAVLTVVVIIIYIMSLITFKIGINAGLSVSLFPMVILTMIIERMSVMWEEQGGRSALQAGVGSMVAAVLCFLTMNNDIIAHLIVTFPELLFVVLGMAMLLGRYQGYKLTEYYRFRVLKNNMPRESG